MSKMIQSLKSWWSELHVDVQEAEKMESRWGRFIAFPHHLPSRMI